MRSNTLLTKFIKQQKELTMKTTLQICATTFAACVVTGNAVASDAIGPGDREARWVVGGGAGVLTSVYRGENKTAAAIPNIRYNGSRFLIRNATLNVSLLQMGPFSGGLIITPDSGLLSDKDEYRDNAQLAGLNERDATVEGGFYINHSSDLGRATLTVLSDLAHEHDGQSATLSYTFDLKLGNWFINPEFGVQWLSAQKTNHYYGVSANEATVDRLAYNAGSALNAFAALRARYEFTQRWDMELHAGAKRLNSSISDSTIVDEDYCAYGGLSINYSF